MSDAVVISLITGVVTVILAIIGVVTLVITLRSNAKQAAIIAAQNLLTANQAQLNLKVDEYHKEVNGNMHKLLETTKKLATAEEKAKHKEG